MMERALSPIKLEHLRRKINSKNYIHAAIHRLALVMSNELMYITQGGIQHGQTRKRRK